MGSPHPPTLLERETENTQGQTPRSGGILGLENCAEPQGRAERGALFFLPHSHTLAMGWEKRVHTQSLICCPSQGDQEVQGGLE